MNISIYIYIDICIYIYIYIYSKPRDVQIKNTTIRKCLVSLSSNTGLFYFLLATLYTWNSMLPFSCLPQYSDFFKTSKFEVIVIYFRPVLFLKLFIYQAGIHSWAHLVCSLFLNKGLLDTIIVLLKCHLWILDKGSFSSDDVAFGPKRVSILPSI